MTQYAISKALFLSFKSKQDLFQVILRCRNARSQKSAMRGGVVAEIWGQKKGLDLNLERCFCLNSVEN